MPARTLVSTAGERDVAAADERERVGWGRGRQRPTLAWIRRSRRLASVSASTTGRRRRAGDAATGAGRGRKRASSETATPVEPILLSMRRNDVPIAFAAALVFADATIVTLALPDLLVDLNTTVYGVAAVLGVYTAVLGVAALSRRLLRGASNEWTGRRAVPLLARKCRLRARRQPRPAPCARAVQGLAGAVILTVAGTRSLRRGRGARVYLSAC